MIQIMTRRVGSIILLPAVLVTHVIRAGEFLGVVLGPVIVALPVLVFTVSVEIKFAPFL
jgi:hypothetical protein